MLRTGLSLHTVRYFVLFFLFNLSYVDASKTPLLPDGQQTQVRVTISPPCLVSNTLLARSTSHGSFTNAGKQKKSKHKKRSNEHAITIKGSVNSESSEPQAAIQKAESRRCSKKMILLFGMQAATMAMAAVNLYMQNMLDTRAEDLGSGIIALGNAGSDISRDVKSLLCYAFKKCITQTQPD